MTCSVDLFAAVGEWRVNIIYMGVLLQCTAPPKGGRARQLAFLFEVTHIGSTIEVLFVPQSNPRQNAICPMASNAPAEWKAEDDEDGGGVASISDVFADVRICLLRCSVACENALTQIAVYADAERQ